MAAQLRPKKMTHQRRILWLAAAGLACALAGCGTAVGTATQASTSPAATASAPGAGGAALAAAAAPGTGCAGVDQATRAVIVRRELVTIPVNGSTRTYTQNRASLVRALFGDFCAAIAHAAVPHGLIDCPADFGTSYAGTFYDGQRVLATFDYSPTGCQRLSLTAAGKTRGTLLIGTAAAAAPHLKADMAAVLGLTEAQVYGPPGSQTAGQAEQGA